MHVMSTSKLSIVRMALEMTLAIFENVSFQVFCSLHFVHLFYTACRALATIHTRCVQFAHNAANLNLGLSKYMKALQ